MNSYEEKARAHRCLECGKKIEYGRSDKKFCNCSCKDRYNNRSRAILRRCRNYTNSCLEKNHEILTHLAEEGIRTINLSDAAILGFNPNFVSARIRVGCHTEYNCYDISYRISDTRIFNIHKLSLTL